MEAKENKYYPLILGSSAIVLSGIAQGFSLAILLLVIYVPVFALFSYYRHDKGSLSKLLIWLFTINLTHAGLQLIFSKTSFASLSLIITIAAIACLRTVPFFLYWLFLKHTKNRIGLFTIIIFWIALEYLLFTQFALGNTPVFSGNWMKWNRYTGVLGVSTWLLVVNVIIYHAFFDQGVLAKRIHWGRFLIALVLIFVPVLISYNWEGGWINADLYTQVHNKNSEFENKAAWLNFYLQNGEYFGRTASWVSILILIFAFVKQKTG